MQTMISRFLWIFGVALALSACGKSGDGGSNGPLGSGGPTTSGTGSVVIDKALLVDLTEVVAIPTYQDLVAHAQSLQQALDALKTATNADNLAKARAAWVAARVPWEQSEALQFGPQRGNGVEKQIDTFPVSEQDVGNVLNSTGAIDVSQLPTDARGFHTIELLLYGMDGTKQPSAFLARELDYMSAAASNLVDVTQSLLTAWTDGVGGNPSWKSLFESAGDPSNASYPTPATAGLVLIEGLGPFLNEVHDTQLVTNGDEVESRYSGNSKDDFINNIKGVQAAYFGVRGDGRTQGTASLAAATALADQGFAATVKSQLSAAIAAIDAIPSPYSTAVGTPDGQAAIAAARAAVQDLIDSDSKLQGMVAP
jgi:uncharacterized iron-regulated protein